MASGWDKGTMLELGITEEMLVGSDLFKRCASLSPEMFPEGVQFGRKVNTPWFTGWKYDDEKRGYVAQWIANMSDGGRVWVNLPNMAFGKIVSDKERFDLGDQRVQPDISDEELRDMVQVGYHQLMVEIAKANGGEWPQGVPNA